jgi:hypothetical protein
MRARWWLPALVLGLVLIAACGGGHTNKAGSQTTSTSSSPDVIALAKQAYAKAKARGVDFKSGPCLGIIAPGWVADVAHNPRLPSDDLPKNQCAAWREGRASHFVELDPKGRVIQHG